METENKPFAKSQSNSGLSRRDLFKGAASVSAVAALSGYTQMAKADDATKISPEPGGGSGKAALPDEASQILAERAPDYLRQVMEVARGPGGFIISHSVFETRLPLQEDSDLDPHLHQVLDAAWGTAAPKPTLAEWYYGENTLWATGWLMWSQMLRYKITSEQEALALSRKGFQDINHAFDLDSTLEPGVLGKPHGGRAGKTTSLDQSANPVLLYVQFAKEYGTLKEQETAKKNMEAHGDYYLRKNWVVNQHGNLSNLLPPRHPSDLKYFAAVYAAYDMTGETRFRDAVEPLVKEIIRRKLFPWPSKKYDLNANLFYYAWLAEYWSKSSLADAYDWMSCLPVLWEAAQKGLDEEGLLLDGIYDTEAKIFTPVKEGYEEKAPPGASSRRDAGRWYRSPTAYNGRTLYSLMVATLGLTVHKHGYDDNAHEVSRKILLRINRDGLRECWDNGRLPPDLLPYANLFGAEFPALWLIGYWMGREQGVW